MPSVSPRARAGLAALGCLVIAIVAALVVDVRLDRHWVLRGLTLLLALGCAAILAVDQGRRARQIIGLVGVLMFGVVFPVTTTIWATPPEIDFALAVATDAEAAAFKDARSVVNPDDVRAAAEARGGAVGTLKTDRTPEVRGADSYPMIVRSTPTEGRPRACITFEHGFDAKVRPC